ncbi:MAG: chemoreceptor glutamine deamidase CheD [Nevskiaceae bacterium]|nr:MAG: chemoreceptor glutamine deamidase CheD [Nevskiaceae bacterium]
MTAARAKVRTDHWAAPSQHGARGNRYYDTRLGSEVIRVLPGDYHVTADDVGLVTTLGSCVSACIRDPQAGIGGINHFMLPESEMSGSGIASARYGGFAMEMLINEVLKQGGRRNRLEAKVFGGANVLQGITSTEVGSRNAHFVVDYLQNEQVPIVAEDLGGGHPRKLVYFPVTGRALVMRLAPLRNREELEAERHYLESLRAPVAGDVELFG